MVRHPRGPATPRSRDAAQVYRSSPYVNSANPNRLVGFLRRPSTNLVALQEPSSATATPIRPMSLRSFVVPRCAWLRPVRSIVLSVRPTASASALSKSLDGNRRPLVRPIRRDPHPLANNNGHQNGSPRLRDRLCLLIRQHQLDANLVKAYAADSCGTPNLRDATREQIEAFITNLAEWATKDRAALLCKLNSYARSQEVTS